MCLLFRSLAMLVRGDQHVHRPCLGIVPVRTIAAMQFQVVQSVVIVHSVFVHSALEGNDDFQIMLFVPQRARRASQKHLSLFLRRNLCSQEEGICSESVHDIESLPSLRLVSVGRPLLADAQ